jgi:hypothetical protein
MEGTGLGEYGASEFHLNFWYSADFELCRQSFCLVNLSQFELEHTFQLSDGVKTLKGDRALITFTKPILKHSRSCKV